MFSADGRGCGLPVQIESAHRLCGPGHPDVHHLETTPVDQQVQVIIVDDDIRDAPEIQRRNSGRVLGTG